MKMITALMLGLTVIMARSLAQGYLVPSGVTYTSYFPATGSIIRVLQNPTNGNYTDFTLPHIGADQFAFNPALDEGVRTFFVGAGDAFTWQAIQSGGYTELLYPNTYLFPEGAPLYVGLYTGEGFPPGGMYANPLFGWAQLVNNGGVIELLGGALAYGSQGIYVGTTTLIPEPSGLSLIGLGLLGLGWRWRQKQRGQSPATK